MFTDMNPGDVAIIREKGRFKQCQLATWNGQLFAKVGGAYVRLTDTGGTSVPSMMLEQLTYDGPLFRDKLGRLCVSSGAGRSALTGDATDKLLLGTDG